jgi:hypothetical protein
MAEVVHLLDQVREVLLREWDPIGIADNPNCRGEYDSYALTIFRHLKRRADEV